MSKEVEVLEKRVKVLEETVSRLMGYLYKTRKNFRKEFVPAREPSESDNLTDQELLDMLNDPSDTDK